MFRELLLAGLRSPGLLMICVTALCAGCSTKDVVDIEKEAPGLIWTSPQTKSETISALNLAVGAGAMDNDFTDVDAGRVVASRPIPLSIAKYTRVVFRVEERSPSVEVFGWAQGIQESQTLRHVFHFYNQYATAAGKPPTVTGGVHAEAVRRQITPN